MIPITYSTVLSFIQYTIYLILIIFSAYYFYHLLTSANERRFYRTKLAKQLAEQKNQIIDKNLKTPFQARLESAGLKFLNAFRYQVIRFSIILFLIFYYVLIPLINRENIQLPLLMLVFFIVLTEPKFKYSLTNIVINFMIYRKQRSKIIEMFTLFDILKAELSSIKDGQEVNMYNIIKNITPMFKHISGTLSRFLSLWKRYPEKAKDVFLEDIGGENAKVLGDILYKLDTVSKGEALKIIETESNVFSYQHFQKELQQSDKSNTAYFVFFMSVNILIIIWFLGYVAIMMVDSMNNTIF